MVTMNVVIGSMIIGSTGNPKEVVKVSGEWLAIEVNGKMVKVSKSAIVSVIHPNPRTAVLITSGRVIVDLDRLSLDYQPLTSIPQWEPTATVKPYESWSKLYIDIDSESFDRSKEIKGTKGAGGGRQFSEWRVAHNWDVRVRDYDRDQEECHRRG